MKQNKKITSLALLGALALTSVVGGSLAWFTDEDDAKNEFTVGNVSIDLIESKYSRVNGDYGDNGFIPELNFEDVDLDGQAGTAPEYTGWEGTYFSDDQIKEDAESYKDGYFADNSELMVPGRNVCKNPYIINEGTVDAYVRARVLIPVSLFECLEDSYWEQSGVIAGGGIISESLRAYYKADFAATSLPKENRDGIDYYEIDFAYQDALKPGEMTFWNSWSSIAIDKDVTSEELANVDSFDVIVEADAIQAEGFENATAAFAAFDAE